MSFFLQRIKGIKNLICSKPALLIFNVTRQCNQHCMMCHIPQKSVNIKLDEITDYAKKLQKFGICEVYLQGGEPLLRKDILDIVDVFIKKSIRPTIITNGELLNQHLIEEIAKRNCNLSVSIDTFKPELYAKLRGNNSLNKVLNNISSINKFKHKGIFSVTSTITKYSDLDDLKDIYNYCKKMNILYYVRPYNYNLDKAGAKSDDLICDREKTLEILEYFNNVQKNTDILTSIIYKENISFIKGKRYNFCDSLKYSMVLNEDGKISPCIEHTDIRFSLNDYKKNAKKLKNMIKNCNKNTPCIYGCTRNVGFLVKNKKDIFLNINNL